MSGTFSTKKWKLYHLLRPYHSAVSPSVFVFFQRKAGERPQGQAVDIPIMGRMQRLCLVSMASRCLQTTWPTPTNHIHLSSKPRVFIAISEQIEIVFSVFPESLTKWHYAIYAYISNIKITAHTYYNFYVYRLYFKSKVCKLKKVQSDYFPSFFICLAFFSSSMLSSASSLEGT